MPAPAAPAPAAPAPAPATSSVSSWYDAGVRLSGDEAPAAGTSGKNAPTILKEGFDNLMAGLKKVCQISCNPMPLGCGSTAGASQHIVGRLHDVAHPCRVRPPY